VIRLGDIVRYKRELYRVVRLHDCWVEIVGVETGRRWVLDYLGVRKVA
jgi:hypothetical protein